MVREGGAGYPGGLVWQAVGPSLLGTVGVRGVARRRVLGEVRRSRSWPRVGVLCRIAWWLEGEMMGVVSHLARRSQERWQQWEEEVRHRSGAEAPACPGWAPQGLAPAARQEGAPLRHQESHSKVSVRL